MTGHRILQWRRWRPFSFQVKANQLDGGFGRISLDEWHTSCVHKTGWLKVEMNVSQVNVPVDQLNRLHVKVSFVIPEETFTPITFEGSIIRLNEKGMLVAVKNVSIEFYRKLLAEKRFLRLVLRTDINNKEKKYTGLVQWLDFHNKGDAGLLNVGFEYVTGSSKEENRPS